MEITSLDKYIEGRVCSIFSIKSFNNADSFKEMQINSSYQIILLKKGKIRHFIDFEWKESEAPYISVLFPNQIHRMELSDDAEAEVLVFDNSVFCSVLLENELKEYNINLKKRINHITDIPEDELSDINSAILSIKRLSGSTSTIKKMEIKFLIKIILLKTIDMAPAYHIEGSIDTNIKIYQKFMDMLNNNFVAQKKVYSYAKELGVTTKKLGIICKKYSGRNTLELIHDHLNIEIKRALLEDGVKLKEIVFKFGFSSQPAFNKYIMKNYGYTPHEWKEHLEASISGK